MNFSEEALVIEENGAEFLMTLGRAAGAEERDDGRVRWAIGNSPIDYHNCVVHAALIWRAISSSSGMNSSAIASRFRSSPISLLPVEGRDPDHQNPGPVLSALRRVVHDGEVLADDTGAVQVLGGDLSHLFGARSVYQSVPCLRRVGSSAELSLLEEAPARPA